MTKSEYFIVIITIAIFMVMYLYLSQSNTIFIAVTSIFTFILYYLAKKLDKPEHFVDTNNKKSIIQEEDVVQEEQAKAGPFQSLWQLSSLGTRISNIMKPSFNHVITAVKGPPSNDNPTVDLETADNDGIERDADGVPISNDTMSEKEKLIKFLKKRQLSTDENTINLYTTANLYLHYLKILSPDEYNSIMTKFQK